MVLILLLSHTTSSAPYREPTPLLRYNQNYLTKTAVCETSRFAKGKKEWQEGEMNPVVKFGVAL